MSAIGIVSADSHINTPRYLYEEFAPARFLDRLPRVESTDEGDFWLFEGTRRPGVIGLSAAGGMKPDEYGVKAVRFDEVRSGSWDTAARVADQDLDGFGGGGVDRRHLLVGDDGDHSATPMAWASLSNPSVTSAVSTRASQLRA